MLGFIYIQAALCQVIINNCTFTGTEAKVNGGKKLIIYKFLGVIYMDCNFVKLQLYNCTISSSTA